jgi:protein-disulfide isomerase
MRRSVVHLVIFGVSALGCAGRSSPARPDDLGPPGTAIAEVDGHPITAADVLARARPRVSRLEEEYARQMHQALGDAVDELVGEELLTARARAKGTTVDALVDELVKRRPEPTDDELQTTYQQNREAGRILPPFPEIKQELKEFRRNQIAREVRARLADELIQGAAIRRSLPPFLPPKVAVPADAPAWRGAGAEAPVTIIEFGNYECNFTGRAESAAKQLLQKYPGKVRLGFRYYPLVEQVNADRAALAALCAGEQGKFWDMHDLLFANPRALDPGHLADYGQQLQLDGARFAACLQSSSKLAAIDQSRQAANAAGVTATPTFFINGRMVTGARPLWEYEEIIEHELGSAGRI